MRIADINFTILSIFIAVHAVTLWLVFVYPFDAKWLVWIVVIYSVRWLAFTCVLHRFFSHNCCKTSRVFQAILALWGTLSMIRGPIRFAAGHRWHHRHSDTPDDLHSVHARGLAMAYIGWVISKDYHEDRLGGVNDLIRHKELVLINRYYFVPNLILLGILYWIGGGALMTWAGFVTVIVTWHMAFTMTVLLHAFGRQRYRTDDQSRNSMLLNILTFGEGWHNNHHANMTAANMGHKWWEFDPGFWVFKLFAWLGLVHELKTAKGPISRYPLIEY